MKPVGKENIMICTKENTLDHHEKCLDKSEKIIRHNMHAPSIESINKNTQLMMIHGLTDAKSALQDGLILEGDMGVDAGGYVRP